MSKQIIFQNNSLDLAYNYKYFILDVWGVIHDGTSTYSGVIENLTKLRRLNKKIYFLSNAPRRAKKVALTLENFGITSNFYDYIITSGEATHLFLKENQDNNFNEYGKNYYYIGPDKDNDLIEDLSYNQVQDAKNANFAIVTGFDNELSEEDEKLDHLKQCLKYNLTLICVNPDLMVIKKTGQEMLCGGLIARQYEIMGGKVIYFGKPYDQVYSAIFSLAQDDDRSKFIAIGDGIETDIDGANKNKIDSALIGGGILSNVLNIQYGKLPTKENMIKVCNYHKIYPKFVLAQL